MGDDCSSPRTTPFLLPTPCLWVIWVPLQLPGMEQQQAWPFRNGDVTAPAASPAPSAERTTLALSEILGRSERRRPGRDLAAEGPSAPRLAIEDLIGRFGCGLTRQHFVEWLSAHKDAFRRLAEHAEGTRLAQEVFLAAGHELRKGYRHQLAGHVLELAKGPHGKELLVQAGCGSGGRGVWGCKPSN